MDKPTSAGLIQVALGHQPADLVIQNAGLLNAYTGELIEPMSVSVKGKWIAGVGEDLAHAIGDQTEVIEAAGKVLIPGLIDGHTHLSSLFRIDEFLKFAMAGGTTTIVTETMEPFPVAGYDGVLELLASFANQPVKIFSTAPAMISISRAAQKMPAETLRKFLDRDDIIGLGESYWQAVLQDPDLLLPRFEQTLRFGKKLEGHSAGARGRKLDAYVATGVSSCHEPINAKEVLERVRLGLYVMIREGSIRRDLETIAEIKDYGIDFRRLILASDGIEPGDLLTRGYMEYIVQKAIDCGIDSIAAIQMATLNVAEHFSIDHLVGGIAPGRFADMVLIPDLKTIEAECVISNGHVIARSGRLLQKPRKPIFSDACRKRVRFNQACQPSDFTITAPSASASAAVRVIEMITDLVSKERIVKLPVDGGEILSDLNQDIVKVAAIDRAHFPGKKFVGLVKGFCMKAGAIASSAAWDSTDIIVVGTTDADMAMAVNRIYELQGGAVVCADNRVMAELPMPIFGLISDLPVPILAERQGKLDAEASRLGIPFPNPFLSLVTLTGAAIPFLRICEEGLVDFKDGRTRNLFV